MLQGSDQQDSGKNLKVLWSSYRRPDGNDARVSSVFL
jgi:hypothetical protein